MPQRLMDKYTKVGLPCLACGEHTEQTLAWLKLHDCLYCFACGTPIDFAAPEFRDYIDGLSKVGETFTILGKVDRVPA